MRRCSRCLIGALPSLKPFGDKLYCASCVLLIVDEYAKENHAPAPTGLPPYRAYYGG